MTSGSRDPAKGDDGYSSPSSCDGGDDPERPTPGLMLGSYRLVRLLGSGGMGWVFEAEHVSVGHRVALKILKKEHTVDRESVARFFAEARAVDRITHPGIVKISDLVEGSEATYIVMELLEGLTLADWLDARPCPLSLVVEVGAAVAEALAAAHEQRVTHRDLKTDNILLLTDEHGAFSGLKVLDFGIAKLHGEAHLADGVETSTGAVLGTPPYMSPEQATGEEVDHRSDIYSLGCVLYEMVTGQHVFRGKNIGELILAHMVETVTPPSKRAERALPPALDDVILRCLEKKADARPQSMKEVAALLRAIDLTELAATESDASLGSPSRPRLVAERETAQLPTAQPRRARSRPKLLFASAAATLTLVVAGALLAVNAREGGGGVLASATVASSGPEAARTQDAPRATVRVELISTPPGAWVTQADTGRVLGTTPFERDLPSDALPQSLLVLYDGYEAEEVRLTSSLTKVRVVLRERARP